MNWSSAKMKKTNILAWQLGSYVNYLLDRIGRCVSMLQINCCVKCLCPISVNRKRLVACLWVVFFLVYWVMRKWFCHFYFWLFDNFNSSSVFSYSLAMAWLFYSGEWITRNPIENQPVSGLERNLIKDLLRKPKAKFGEESV